MRLFRDHQDNALSSLHHVGLFQPADGDPRGKSSSVPVSTATCPEHSPSMMLLRALITFPSRVASQIGACAGALVYRTIIHRRSQEGITETVRFDDTWQLLLTMKLPVRMICPFPSELQVTLRLTHALVHHLYLNLLYLCRAEDGKHAQLPLSLSCFMLLESLNSSHRISWLKSKPSPDNSFFVSLMKVVFLIRLGGRWYAERGVISARPGLCHPCASGPISNRELLMLCTQRALPKSRYFRS